MKNLPTQLMGILNVTPDSCFDKGKWFDTSIAIARGIEMAKEGADWIDIGGESTRPGAQPVSEEEELRRVIPVISELKREVSIPLSIDTMKVNVAEKALIAGATLINDVSGFRDPAMIELAKEANVHICVMHMHETPTTMQNNPVYPLGVVPFLMHWFIETSGRLLKAGIEPNKILLDPGIGFGKTIADNQQILHNLHEFKALGFPLLIGLSRKSFLGKMLNKGYPELLSASLAANALAILANVDIIRVHDVKEHRDLIDILSHFK